PVRPYGPLEGPYFWLVLALALGAIVIGLAAALAQSPRFAARLGRLFGRRRRRRFSREPFPEALEVVLRANVPAYLLLSPQEQRCLREDVRTFLRRKRFEGCRGQEITDEVRVTIAGHACRLLVGWDDHDCFAGVDAVLVYPTGFAVEDDEGGRGREARS